jgi:hypothetical protein
MTDAAIHVISPIADIGKANQSLEDRAMSTTLELGSYERGGCDACDEPAELLPYRWLFRGMSFPLWLCARCYMQERGSN